VNPRVVEGAWASGQVRLGLVSPQRRMSVAGQLPRSAHRVYQISPKLWDRINYFSKYPQTGVSLRQMVVFGRHANPGTIMLAGSFLMGMYVDGWHTNADELPVRLARRVKDLHNLPPALAQIPSILRVKSWYAQSFEVRIASSS